MHTWCLWWIVCGSVRVRHNMLYIQCVLYMPMFKRMCAKVQESACVCVLFKETVSTSGNRGILFVSCTHCSADYPPPHPYSSTYTHIQNIGLMLLFVCRPQTCTHQCKDRALTSCLTLNTLSLHCL